MNNRLGVVVLLLLLLAGGGMYYYQATRAASEEADARQRLIQAREEFRKSIKPAPAPTTTENRLP